MLWGAWGVLGGSWGFLGCWGDAGGAWGLLYRKFEESANGEREEKSAFKYHLISLVVITCKV